MANFVEKENVFLRIAKYLIPWKGDRPAEIIRKLIFIAAAAVLAVSLVSLLVTAENKRVDTNNNNSLSEIFHGATSGSTKVEIDTTKREELQKEHPQVMERFLPLLEINEDVIGWITIGDKDDPVIDYVVMQCDDNDYYLNHNYKREESVSGAIFADYHEKITAEGGPANTVLYGHNMMSGEYFAQLTKYFNSDPGANKGMDFYNKYPTVTFSTLYKESTYKIFAGMLVNTEKEDGKVFHYISKRNFDSKSDFDKYVGKILDRTTFINPDVNLKYGDKLLTLSTCFWPNSQHDMRWVVFAREVREGESPEVDVTKAYENPDPLFFDYYYSVYGGEWGGRKWPEELIQGYSHSDSDQ